MHYDFVERRFNGQCYDYLNLVDFTSEASQAEIVNGLVHLVAVQDAMIHLLAEHQGIDVEVLIDGARKVVVGFDLRLSGDGRRLEEVDI